jgi:nitrate/nitrite-specific signal transduction histidine kinase
VEAELLRIVQEALANARKHSHAENIWISSRIQPPLFEIKVEDDGQGLGQGRDDSYGLKIMGERAERIGGDLEVGARDTGGTIVRVWRA